MRRKKHNHDSAPAPANADLPHLRNGGGWSAPGGLPKRRMELYLGRLKDLGMTERDAQGLVADLYWDCAAELDAHRHRCQAVDDQMPENIDDKAPQKSSGA